jgi:hypothetical protein
MYPADLPGSVSTSGREPVDVMPAGSKILVRT